MCVCVRVVRVGVRVVGSPQTPVIRSWERPQTQSAKSGNVPDLPPALTQGQPGLGTSPNAVSRFWERPQNTVSRFWERLHQFGNVSTNLGTSPPIWERPHQIGNVPNLPTRATPHQPLAPLPLLAAWPCFHFYVQEAIIIPIPYRATPTLSHTYASHLAFVFRSRFASFHSGFGY